MSSGGLGVLKAWLEPYADGSLPNARIRAAILKACKVRGFGNAMTVMYKDQFACYQWHCCLP